MPYREHETPAQVLSFEERVVVDDVVRVTGFRWHNVATVLEALVALGYLRPL